MRIPLPVLAAAIMVIAAGVATIHISVPNKPASLFINASALQPGQNITIHLNYIPMNITILTSTNVPVTVVCMYFHGVLVSRDGYSWVNMYINRYGGDTRYGSGAANVAFISAVNMRDSNITIFITPGDWFYNCPPSVR